MNVLKKSTVFVLASVGLSANLAAANLDFQSVECTNQGGRNKTTLTLWRDSPDNYSVRLNMVAKVLGDQYLLNDYELVKGLKCKFQFAAGTDIPVVKCGDVQQGLFKIDFIDRTATRFGVDSETETGNRAFEVMFNQSGRDIDALNSYFLNQVRPIAVPVENAETHDKKEQIMIDAGYQAMVVERSQCSFIR